MKTTYICSGIVAVILLLSISMGAIASTASPDQTEFSLQSPNGRIRVSISIPGADSLVPPSWSASYRGKQILANCWLSLLAKNSLTVSYGERVLSLERRSVDNTIPVLFGKSSSAHDRYRELYFRLDGKTIGRTDLVFRCYDDAIAFRYELPKRPDATTVVVPNEETSFQFAGNPTANVQYLENYTTSHEHNVTQTPYNEIKPDTLMDTPLTLTWKDGMCAAITEAALRNYSGMSLMRMKRMSIAPEPRIPYLTTRLTPGRGGGAVIRSSLPVRTPWRVVLLGDKPGALLESNTLYCLNEPSVIKDTSWIKPGKITFSWWNGDVYDGKKGLPILSLEMAKKYIDFCAANNIPTHSLTSDDAVNPWYHQSSPGVVPGPDTDVTRPRAEFDIDGIRKYAKSKGIRLWTWVHQGALRGRVEEAFTAFEKMGWSGMMVDFFDHDDQESVEFSEQILESAARHHIMIHLHGVWKPTGLQRTYPNLMNHEGALNLEYLKWSDRCTPDHDLKMVFTRLVAGPMDYHLGGFRAVTRDKFQFHNVAPNVLGTRCHMLAAYVCYDNPNPMVADYPTAYIGEPGFDFIKLVPTWWDETRVLAGKVGEVLVTARRKGTTWYVGGMSAGSAKNVKLPLSFLGKMSYTAKIWKDANDSDSEPNHLTSESHNLKSTDTLDMHFARDGGFVAQITPNH